MSVESALVLWYTTRSISYAIVYRHFALGSVVKKDMLTLLASMVVSNLPPIVNHSKIAIFKGFSQLMKLRKIVVVFFVFLK